MSEPRRLFEDPEMGALLRADLEAAKRIRVDYDVERGVERHMALVGAGVIGILGGAAAHSTSSLASAAGGSGATSAVTATGATSAVTATGATSAVSGATASAATGGVLSAVKAAIVAKGIWVAAGVGVAAVAGAGAQYVAHKDEGRPAVVAAPPQTQAPLVANKPPTPIDQPPTAEAANQNDSVDPSSLPVAQLDQPKTAQPKPRPNIDADEAATYANARSIATKDPKGALEILQTSEERFRGGILSEEREALAIQCLARLGRDSEARTRAEAFLKAHPSSPLAERVRHDAKLE